MIPQDTVLISQRIKVYTPQYPEGKQPKTFVPSEIELPDKGIPIVYPEGKKPPEIIPPKP